MVAYMSRNFFSRGVLNEHDILRYILAKYNVTLRVTTFEVGAGVGWGGGWGAGGGAAAAAAACLPLPAVPAAASRGGRPPARRGWGARLRGVGGTGGAGRLAAERRRLPPCPTSRPPTSSTPRHAPSHPRHTLSAPSPPRLPSLPPPLQEPLLEAMELLQHADVLIGMHGAGWTNGMFVKHGAVAMQMFPYGWRLPDNSTIRG